MASVQELIAAANNETRNSSPVASSLQNLLTGISQSQNDGLDRTIKLMQLDQMRKQQEAQAKMRADLAAQIGQTQETQVTQAHAAVGGPPPAVLPADKLERTVKVDEKGNLSYEYKAKPTKESSYAQEKYLDASGKARIGAFDSTTGKTIQTPADPLAPADVADGEKAAKADQSAFDKITKEINPTTASSRTTLGMASRANMQADRALVTLSKPTVTYQEAGNVMADIAGIYAGGAPTDQGMTHQDYTTIYGKVEKGLQALTGNPQDALPDALKQRLIANLNDMKQTNSDVINQNLDFTEKAHKKTLSKFPDEWKSIRDQFAPPKGAPAPAAGIQPKQINSQAEYDALPSGSSYIDSNGTPARKK